MTIALFVIAVFIKIRNQNIFGNKDLLTCKRIQIKAKVINKIDRPANPVNAPDPFAHIMFESEDGQRFDFAVTNLAKYNSIIINDMGILIYAGRAFIDFQRISE